MKKFIIFALVCFTLNIASFAHAERADYEKVFIENMSFLQFNNKIKLRDAEPVLGSMDNIEIVNQDYGRFILGSAANGKIWLNGTTNEDTPGRITRLITNLPSAKTFAGIGVGASEIESLDAHRTPDYIKTDPQSKYFPGIIKWHIYFPDKDELTRLFIGFNNNNTVGAIGFSGYAGGL